MQNLLFFGGRFLGFRHLVDGGRSLLLWSYRYLIFDFVSRVRWLSLCITLTESSTWIIFFYCFRRWSTKMAAIVLSELMLLYFTEGLNFSFIDSLFFNYSGIRLILSKLRDHFIRQILQNMVWFLALCLRQPCFVNQESKLIDLRTTFEFNCSLYWWCVLLIKNFRLRVLKGVEEDGVIRVDGFIKWANIILGNRVIKTIRCSVLLFDLFLQYMRMVNAVKPRVFFGFSNLLLLYRLLLLT